MRIICTLHKKTHSVRLGFKPGSFLPHPHILLLISRGDYYIKFYWLFLTGLLNTLALHWYQVQLYMLYRAWFLSGIRACLNSADKINIARVYSSIACERADNLTDQCIFWGFLQWVLMNWYLFVRQDSVFGVNLNFSHALWVFLVTSAEALP